MEVGQEDVDDTRLVWRVDEDVRLAGLRGERPSDRFQDAGACRSDGDDSLRCVNRGGRLAADRELFRMHAVLREVVDLDGTESPDTDVQSEERVRHSGEDFGREMKTCGRRGHG